MFKFLTYLRRLFELCLNHSHQLFAQDIKILSVGLHKKNPNSNKSIKRMVALTDSLTKSGFIRILINH